MKKKSLNFWSSRAKNKAIAGSNDPYLDKCETNMLISFIPKQKKKILDIGCGTGSFLQQLVKKNKLVKCTGIDFSKEMVSVANKKNKCNSINYYTLDMKNILKLKKKIDFKFDYIITKRSIINILSKNLQLKILDNLGKLLNKNGKILSCECSSTDQNNINQQRVKFGLNKIYPPWHNLYFSDTIIKRKIFKNIKLINIHNFTSTYYFVSRVINAIINKQNKSKLHYSDKLNLIGWKLDQSLIKGFSQTKIYEFKKK